MSGKPPGIFRQNSYNFPVSSKQENTEENTREKAKEKTFEHLDFKISKENERKNRGLGPGPEAGPGPEPGPVRQISGSFQKNVRMFSANVGGAAFMLSLIHI